MELKMKSQDYIKRFIPFLGLILMILVFQIFSGGKLLIRGNIISVLNQTYSIVIIALGAVFVFAHGGMDLSYGGVLGVSVLTTTLMAKEGAPIAVLILAGVLTAVAWYAVNGLVSVYFKVSPFITSLCILYICRGILNTVCAKKKYSVPVTLYDFDNWVLKSVVLILVIAATYLLFEKTSIGKSNKAIGGNPAASRQVGINVKSMKMAAYMISAVTVGIASFFMMIRAGSVSTTTGQGLEMNIVTALVLGGVSLSGGSKVKIYGAILGSFSVVILRNGLIILGINERIIEGVQGLVLLLIVFLTYVKNKDNVLN